jgi:hypothetical protein
MNTWIQCSERLPEKPGRYLVHIPAWTISPIDIALWRGGQVEGYPAEWAIFVDEDWLSLDYYRLNYGPISITHWMPLPEVPA